MSVASIAPAYLLPPVAAVLPTARVVRGDASAKNSKTGAKRPDGGERPFAALTNPAEASSSATQAALLELPLGG